MFNPAESHGETPSKPAQWPSLAGLIYFPVKRTQSSLEDFRQAYAEFSF
jgi:hypothetical protein